MESRLQHPTPGCCFDFLYLSKKNWKRKKEFEVKAMVCGNVILSCTPRLSPHGGAHDACHLHCALAARKKRTLELGGLKNGNF